MGALWVAKSLRFFRQKSTVNLEIFMRILFLRIALKDIFATLDIRDLCMVYVYQ